MNYNFKCKCSLCSSTNDERDSWIGEKSRRSDVLDFAERFAMRAHAENDVKQEIALLHECLRLRESCCHTYDRLILKTRNALMSACLSQGDYEQAALHCEIVVRMYSKIYHPMHPMTALQLSTLGNLRVEIGEVEKGLKELESAVQVLRVTHGKDSSLVHSIEALIRDTTTSSTTQ